MDSTRDGLCISVYLRVGIPYIIWVYHGQPRTVLTSCLTFMLANEKLNIYNNIKHVTSHNIAGVVRLLWDKLGDNIFIIIIIILYHARTPRCRALLLLCWHQRARVHQFSAGRSPDRYQRVSFFCHFSLCRYRVFNTATGYFNIHCVRYYSIQWYNNI